MEPIKGVGGDIVQIPNMDRGRQQKGGFQETLNHFVHQVDSALKEADQSVRDLAVGKRHDLHEIMIATEKADVSFKFLMKIRNKLLEAYQEIMRMPL